MFSLYNVLFFMSIVVVFGGIFILDASMITDDIIVNFFMVTTALPVIVPYTEGMQLFNDVIAVSLLCRCHTVLYICCQRSSVIADIFEQACNAHHCKGHGN